MSVTTLTQHEREEAMLATFAPSILVDVTRGHFPRIRVDLRIPNKEPLCIAEKLPEEAAVVAHALAARNGLAIAVDMAGPVGLQAALREQTPEVRVIPYETKIYTSRDPHALFGPGLRARIYCENGIYWATAEGREDMTHKSTTREGIDKALQLATGCCDACGQRRPIGPS